MPSTNPILMEDYDSSSLSDNFDPKVKPPTSDYGFGFAPRAGGIAKSVLNTLSLAKSHSICDVNKPNTPRSHKLGTDAYSNVDRGGRMSSKASTHDPNSFKDVNETLYKMLRRGGSHMDTEWEREAEPKARLNSLIGIMVSTIMCVAAKCPIPRSNIQATKLFLSTVVNDNGETPTNIKGLLRLLRSYDGPFEGDAPKQVNSQKRSTAETTSQKREEAKKLPPPDPAPMEKIMAPRIRSRLPSCPPVKRNREQKKQGWNF